MNRLLKLVQEYQSKVLEAASLFEKHKGVLPIHLMSWRQCNLPQAAFLDPENKISYSFHGIGCRDDLPEGEIDWDFGNEGRLDGFDAWRLWRFADEGTESFSEFKNKSLLDKTFAEAISDGMIHRPHRHLQDDLYYLREVGADQ